MPVFPELDIRDVLCSRGTAQQETRGAEADQGGVKGVARHRGPADRPEVLCGACDNSCNNGGNDAFMWSKRIC
jgi:hypothetical protein